MSKFKDIISAETPVLVDFHATWCGPCQTLAPIINDVKSKFGEKLRILKVDVDKNVAASAKYKVRGVPTLILFKKGEIMWRQSGVMSRRDLEGKIEPYL